MSVSLRVRAAALRKHVVRRCILFHFSQSKCNPQTESQWIADNDVGEDEDSAYLPVRFQARYVHTC